jgi:hypothetical protein
MSGDPRHREMRWNVKFFVFSGEATYRHTIGSLSQGCESHRSDKASVSCHD